MALNNTILEPLKQKNLCFFNAVFQVSHYKCRGSSCANGNRSALNGNKKRGYAKPYQFPICKDRDKKRLPYIQGLRGQVAVMDNQLKLSSQTALDSGLHTHTYKKDYINYSSMGTKAELWHP